MVAFGRQKGDRGSYRQWVEDGIAPQVVFEILSPGNRMAEMSRKLDFSDRYGVEEYYIYDPDRLDFTGWIRNGVGGAEPVANRLELIRDDRNWVSPRLGIRFKMQDDTLIIYHPDDRPFLSFVEIDQLRQQATQQAQQAEQKAEKLAAKLRELGIDPNNL
jgi:hypothetical protein